MIPTQTLKYLIKNKIKDAEVLIKNKRYGSSIYLAGYAVEIALKYKICITLGFDNGFPENKIELSNYLRHINSGLPKPLTLKIGQIRNHSLIDLLIHSGIELKVKSHYLDEWAIVNS